MISVIQHLLYALGWLWEKTTISGASGIDRYEGVSDEVTEGLTRYEQWIYNSIVKLVGLLMIMEVVAVKDKKKLTDYDFYDWVDLIKEQYGVVGLVIVVAGVVIFGAGFLSVGMMLGIM